MFAGDPWWAWALDSEDRALALGVVAALLEGDRPTLLGLRFREITALLVRSGRAE
jgi:hypothetical protein